MNSLVQLWQFQTLWFLKDRWFSVNLPTKTEILPSCSRRFSWILSPFSVVYWTIQGNSSALRKSKITPKHFDSCWHTQQLYKAKWNWTNTRSDKHNTSHNIIVCHSKTRKYRQLFACSDEDKFCRNCLTWGNDTFKMSYF